MSARSTPSATLRDAQPTSVARPSLAAELAEARRKIEEDLLRFRTCCADPRASK